MRHWFVAANGLFGLNRAPVFCRRKMCIESEDEVECEFCAQVNRAAPNAVTFVSKPAHRPDLGRNCSLLMLNGLMPFGHKCHAV
jgi:hypothetical protein